jgi:hypothetical protein
MKRGTIIIKHDRENRLGIFRLILPPWIGIAFIITRLRRRSKPDPAALSCMTAAHALAISYFPLF